MKTAVLVSALVAMATAASVAQDSPIDTDPGSGKFLLIRHKRKTATTTVLATTTTTVPVMCDATQNLELCPVPTRRRRSVPAPRAILPEAEAALPPTIQLDSSLQQTVSADQPDVADGARLLVYSTTTVTTTIGTITVTVTNHASTQSVVFSSCFDVDYVLQLSQCPTA